LIRCRAPLQFLSEHWRAGRAGALWMGLIHGLYCIGCCWAIMVLAFVGGVMSLLWMGLATLFMVAEKLPDIGAYIRRPAGTALIGAGALVCIVALSRL